MAVDIAVTQPAGIGISRTQACCRRNRECKERERFGARSGRRCARASSQLYGRDCAAAGGLMGLAAPVAEQWCLVSTYTGRILKGDKPGTLPVQQSTKIDLTINMNAAKALGLTVPAALLSRADKVIE